jgi:hypothetical protein
MYILKSTGILLKQDYNQLTTHLRDWRKEGRIGWDQIADGSGRGIINDFQDYKSHDTFVDYAANFLKNGGAYYRKYLNTEWRWFGQPHYEEIWIEKHAIVGTVAALVGNRFVKVGFNKGNPGWGYMHDNCERLRRELVTTNKNSKSIRRQIHVFYLGDDDKQGLHMDEEIRAQLDFFGMSSLVKFERIGVTKPQIKQYDLPANFETGEGYEVDALNAFKPLEFRKLIHEHIDQYFDEDIHKRILEQYPVEVIQSLIDKKVMFRD